eukprot:scaffold84687_cov61-Attheya_sp.AAC.2
MMKKKQYLQACMDQQKKFALFLSYDSQSLENHIFESMWIFQQISDEHCSSPCHSQLFARILSSRKGY